MSNRRDPSLLAGFRGGATNPTAPPPRAQRRDGGHDAVKSGAVTAVQRTSGDMRLNPHLHVVFLDGAYHEDGTELVWNELGHLPTRAVGQVLERQTC
ncbi:transposase [Sorangium cellulosum]|uniref:transposase n=1 Tax=Sorangium cellulosum TaxID=56 RepID=UPI000B29D99E|nr:transposase [Sorangium cellulosum]